MERVSLRSLDAFVHLKEYLIRICPIPGRFCASSSRHRTVGADDCAFPAHSPLHRPRLSKKEKENDAMPVRRELVPRPAVARPDISAARKDAVTPRLREQIS